MQLGAANDRLLVFEEANGGQLSAVDLPLAW
jgi:hypothetical protein